jgi:hypothetical protein
VCVAEETRDMEGQIVAPPNQPFPPSLHLRTWPGLGKPSVGCERATHCLLLSILGKTGHSQEVSGKRFQSAIITLVFPSSSMLCPSEITGSLHVWGYRLSVLIRRHGRSLCRMEWLKAANMPLDDKHTCRGGWVQAGSVC